MIKNYVKPAVQPMRPYIPGEDLEGVSVSVEDTPELGGMIAIGADNGACWYVSKTFFNTNYVEEHTTTIMTFGQATEAAKRGYKVARSGWNGAGMFAYIVPANKYSTDGNPTSPVKGMFPDDMVPYREYWALKTAQNDVAAWSPSGSDSLAVDWCIVE